MAKLKNSETLVSKEEAFNDKLINSLPGIFYMYELTDDGDKLVRWNNNYEKVTGYSSAELLNMGTRDFFLEEDFPKIKEAAEQVLKIGKGQLEAKLKLKNGNSIPYYFEGYRFDNEGKTCFMGVGIDISLQRKTELDLEKAKYEQRLSDLKFENLKNILDIRNKEMTYNIVSLMKRNEVLVDISKRLTIVENSIIKDETRAILKTISRDLKKSTEEKACEEFDLRFKQVHSEFYMRLYSKFPKLTRNELRICAFLKLKMTNKEISGITGQRIQTLEIGRARLRKKLGIGNSSINLIGFISEI